MLVANATVLIRFNISFQDKKAAVKVTITVEYAGARKLGGVELGQVTVKDRETGVILAE